MSHLTLSYVKIRDQVCQTVLTGPREAFERTTFWRDFIPPPGRRYVRWSTRPFGAFVGATNRKVGDVVVRILHWHIEDTTDLEESVIQALIEARAQPGRPANWPFSTWGGRA